MMRGDKEMPPDIRDDIAQTGLRMASLDDLIERLEKERDNLTSEQVKRLDKIIPSCKNRKYRGLERPDKW